MADIREGMRLFGVLADQPVTAVSFSAMGEDDGILTYVSASGDSEQRIVSADDLPDLLVLDDRKSGPRFDADPVGFRLAAEALRIKYATAYDPMAAVYSSNIDPLPHQIRAVYEDLLPRVPLRFLLADDPGAGKTVMAGLYIKEMMMRSAAERVIVVCPGSLAEQWRDELRDKFDLDFEVFENWMVDQARDGNPFREHDCLIVRMDQLARNDEYRGMLADVSWDIAVVDEAHRMSAHYLNIFGEREVTKRFRMGEILAATSENLLLMTATPHAGKEADFQLFMSLLDPDRFSGVYKPKRHARTDLKGLMRRMVKEDLLTFDGKPLFPERRAMTVPYELSDAEALLYEHVTEYVRHGMNQAEKVMSQDGRRASSIGFALTILQRRLASSPEAIYQSLRRRRDRLADTLRELDSDPQQAARILAGPERAAMTWDVFDEQWDESDEHAQLQLELDMDEIVDSATAARTRAELETEISELDILVEEAKQVRDSGKDTKWVQLAGILQRNILDYGTAPEGHKLIVFTEHRDTLEYLADNIRSLLGRQEAAVTIHGGMGRAERKAVQERFVHDPDARILVATDAAGEGLNLQRADLMVNYDLPWNPNRIEQRFGRIHRIGQTRVCCLWNLVATNTREGDVYKTLLDKIATIDKAYQGRLFNVLGDTKAFGERSLGDLIQEAIRYGDDPMVQARARHVVDATVGRDAQRLLEERALHPEQYTTVNVDEVRRLMEHSRERKLQPGYIAAFFTAAFRKLGGHISPLPHGRWRINRVPSSLVRVGERLNRNRPLSRAYECVTFDTANIDMGPGTQVALLIAPGSPLLDALIELVLERYGNTLEHGTVFVDRTDTQPDGPELMTAAEQTIIDDHGTVLSRHFDYLTIGQDTQPRFSPAPPYLDYSKPVEQEQPAIERILAHDWLGQDYTAAVQQYAYVQGAKPRMAEIKARLDTDREHELDQVEQRLGSEIEFWWSQYNQRVDNERNGKHGRKPASPAAAMKRAKDMEERLTHRREELSRPVRVSAKPATIRGTALVIPSRLLEDASDRRQEEASKAAVHAVDTREVDRRAVALVMAAEEALGRIPEEMPHNNKGYDIRSTGPGGITYFIEVKGRIDLPGADTFHITANEVAFAQSQGDRHRLALVKVSPDGSEHDQVRYVTHAFDGKVLDQATVAYEQDLATYWKRGTPPM